MIKYLVLIFITLSVFINTNAQEKSVKDIDWLAVGFGIGEDKHISNFISYSFVDENIYQLSVNGNQEFSIFRINDPDYVVSTTFAYGKKVEWLFVFGGLFAGPSFVFGKKKGEQIKYTIGVNINSQILFSPSDVLGVGIDVFGNINFYEPIYGIRLAIFFKSIK